MKPRRRLVASLSSAITLVLVALAWVLFAPPQLGGQTSYVIVNGNSMEPGMHRGDLAIVREQGTYKIGDVVTYQHPQIGPVIHRIIGIDGARYVFQGDHNDFIDPYHPMQEELIGGLWIHVPGVGSWLSRFRSPVYMTGLLCIAFMGFGGATALKNKSNPEPGRRARPAAQPAQSSATIGGTPMQQMLKNWQDTVSVIVAGGVVLLGLAWVSMNRPTHHDVPANLPYAQSGRFAYSAPTADGRVYDSGEATSGEPVYRRLSQAVAFQFDYRFDSAARATIGGTYRMVAELGDKSGWRRTIELTPETNFDGDKFSAYGVLDLAEAQALISILEEQSGVKNERYSLSVKPKVTLSGSVEGTPFDDAFAPVLTMSLEPLQLRMEVQSQNETPLAPRNDGIVSTLVPEVNTIRLLVFSLPVAAARAISLAGLGLLLALGGWLLMAAVQQSNAGSKAGQPSGTLLRSPLVNVRGTVPTPRARVIDVASLDDLGRIAARIGGVVLQEARPGYHAYFVHDREITYRYEALGTNQDGQSQPAPRRIA